MPPARVMMKAAEVSRIERIVELRTKSGSACGGQVHHAGQRIRAIQNAVRPRSTSI